MKTLKLERKIKKLKPADIAKVENYIDSLSDNKKTKSGRKLKQNWAGALEKFKKDWTSLELQKNANYWR